MLLERSSLRKVWFLRLFFKVNINAFYTFSVYIVIDVDVNIEKMSWVNEVYILLEQSWPSCLNFALMLI